MPSCESSFNARGEALLKKSNTKILITVAVLIASFWQIRISEGPLLDEACAGVPSAGIQLAQLSAPADEQPGQQAQPIQQPGRRPSAMPQRPAMPPQGEPVAPQGQPMPPGAQQMSPQTGPQVSQPMAPAQMGQPQPQAGPGPAATSQSAAAPTPIQAPSGQQRVAPAIVGGQVTLNFDDADVYSLIQTVFGDVLRVNYIVDPRVKGRVTFRSVAPVPRDSILPLMEVVLRLNGIGIVEEGGLYRIVPISDIAKEPAPISIGRDPNKIPSTGKSLLQVVPIRYVSSSEVIRLIMPFLSANALVVDIPKGNQIIIVDTDANVKRLLRLVDVFDNEGVKQKKPQIFVYHCQNGKAKDIATTLQQMFLGARTSGGAAAPSTPVRQATSSQPSASMPGQPVISSPGQSMMSSSPGGGEQLVSEITRIFPDEILNAVIVLATPDDYELIKQTIERIDIVPRQVVIEGVIAQVTLTDNLSLGLSALFKGSIFGLDATIALNGSNLSVDPAKPSGAGFTFVGTDSGGKIRAVITALATESKAKLLAAPHILVSDNREARIQVGQQVPITTSETYGAVGVAPQRIVQYKDIGIILKVKPRVNEGGLVALEVGQEVSTFSTIPLGNAGETQIIINKTEASTNLVVQDGQTIVIGGLIREDNSKALSGVPFLSKIPLIGWLFGNTQDDKSRAELIILLTPHVIKNQKDAQAVTSDYVDQMTESSKGRIQKEDLIKKEKQGLQSGKDTQMKAPAPPASSTPVPGAPQP
jgi:type II secretory pathway component GspD/PulD (secretin)